MSELPILTSVQQFLLNSPLYELYTTDINVVSALYGRTREVKFDGHCPYCNKETTYCLSEIQHIAVGDPWNNIRTHSGFGRVAITCSRKDSHRVCFYFHLSAMRIQKVGQLPSLADIATDEVKKYRSEMSKQDGFEFHRAIGLAAHGVGVGSFVYLRRVFERLIYSRFQEFKEIESWSEEEFRVMKMNEKIDHLREHLPDFLVKNSKLYSILSVGIHELEEEKCLAAFGILKDSIIIILDEDKKKKDELALRKKLEASIAAFKA